MNKIQHVMAVPRYLEMSWEDNGWTTSDTWNRSTEEEYLYESLGTGLRKNMGTRTRDRDSGSMT